MVKTIAEYQAEAKPRKFFSGLAVRAATMHVHKK